MFRTILAVAAFCACAYAGVRKKNRLLRHEQTLVSLCRELRRLCAAMSYRRAPLGQIAETLGDENTRALWQCFAKELAHHDAATAWETAVGETAVCKTAVGETEGCTCGVSLLTAAELNALRDVGAVLVSCDEAEREKGFSAATAALMCEAEALREAFAKKGGIYSKLGIISGLAAALILI